MRMRGCRRGVAVLLLLVAWVCTGCTGGNGAGAGAGDSIAGAGKGSETAAFPGRLAYVRAGDIYILTAGQAPVPVTRDGRNLSPAWSPDGRWLVFQKRTDSGLSELWSVTAGGADPRRLDPGVAIPAVWTAFAWAPAGNRLAYVALDSRNRPAELRLVDFAAAGPGQPQRLLVAPAGIFGFAWAPDGKRLAVSSGSARPGSGAAMHIAAVTATGTPDGILVDGAAVAAATGVGALPAELGLLTWSPDGRWLTFAGLPMTAGQGVEGVHLYLAQAGKGQVYHLGTMLAYPQWLQWSPQGDRLAVITGAGRSAGQGKVLRIYDPWHPDQAAPALTPAGYVDRDPHWAAGGDRLIVSRMPEEPAPAPGTAGADTLNHQARAGALAITRPTPLAAVAADRSILVTDGRSGADLAPRFSADGGQVLFVRLQEGRPAVWLSSADGESSRLLVQEMDLPPAYYGEMHMAAVLSWTGGK